MLTNSTQSQPRILLCDDSPVERLALAHFLRQSGYAVDEAGDGESAILHLKHRPVDLVLLDLHMPQVDGFEVLGYLQEHRRALPVVLLSGMPLHRIQNRIHGLPSHELPPLLIKPIDPDQLLGILELQLSGGIASAPDSPPAPGDAEESAGLG
jgi:CheY-like chemotaxis protein